MGRGAEKTTAAQRQACVDEHAAGRGFTDIATNGIQGPDGWILEPAFITAPSVSRYVHDHAERERREELKGDPQASLDATLQELLDDWQARVRRYRKSKKPDVGQAERLAREATHLQRALTARPKTAQKRGQAEAKPEQPEDKKPTLADELAKKRREPVQSEARAAKPHMVGAELLNHPAQHDAL